MVDGGVMMPNADGDGRWEFQVKEGKWREGSLEEVLRTFACYRTFEWFSGAAENSKKIKMGQCIAPLLSTRWP